MIAARANGRDVPTGKAVVQFLHVRCNEAAEIAVRLVNLQPLDFSQKAAGRLDIQCVLSNAAPEAIASGIEVDLHVQSAAREKLLQKGAVRNDGK